MTPDTIEKQITIEAARGTVWQLVSEPGWWINDGDLVEHTISEQGEIVLVTDPTHGTFPLAVVGREEPDHVAFRWVPWDDGGSTEDSTLVEFFLTGAPEGPTTVRVLESGFGRLALDEERRRANHEENTRGWEAELDALGRHLAPARTGEASGAQ